MMSALRWAAVTIAVIAAIDPSVTLAGRVRPTIGLLAPRGSVGDTLRRDLHADFSIVDAADPTAAALVVVGDRYPQELIPESMRVATVSLPEAGIRIASVDAPRAVPVATTIHLDAEVVAAGLRGRTTTLTASIGGAELARASHEWRDQSPWRASLDLVPIGEPPFVVTLAVDGGAAGATAVVDVSDRLPVLVYDARPSWTTTFVRRALENDPRFVVNSIGLASRGVVVRTAQAADSLQNTDVDRYRVVIVGGLEKLSANDVAALNRFMIDRGGSVAVLPDARVDSDVVRALIPSAFGREVLLERPTELTSAAPLPRIDASELLPSAAPLDAQVLAKTDTAAIVWTMPRGEGRLLVSGAMDAWRFRTPKFDGFWQSAIAGLALAVRPAVSVDVRPSAIPFGESARVRVRVRQADPSQPLSVSAVLASGEPIRLWPDAERGTFSGVLTPARGGVDRLEVITVSGGRSDRASMRFVAGAYALPVDDPMVPLSSLSASHGGIDVSPNNLSALERWLRQTILAKTTPMERHPMRSAWWILPFAGCLCGEWWMRRRRGLR